MSIILLHSRRTEPIECTEDGPSHFYGSASTSRDSQEIGGFSGGPSHVKYLSPSKQGQMKEMKHGRSKLW